MVAQYEEQYVELWAHQPDQLNLQDPSSDQYFKFRSPLFSPLSITSSEAQLTSWRRFSSLKSFFRSNDETIFDIPKSAGHLFVVSGGGHF